MISRISRLYSASPLFSLLQQQTDKFPYKDAWQFPLNSVNWTFAEVDRHASAYALGLAELGLSPGSKLATWLSCSELPETLIVNLACGKAGLQMCCIGDQSDWEETMKSTDALVVSPWKQHGEEYRIDFILNEIPEMKNNNTGSLLKSEKYKKLKWVIQTGFKTIRGSLKLKHLPVYND